MSMTEEMAAMVKRIEESPWVVGFMIAKSRELDMSRAGRCYELSGNKVVDLFFDDPSDGDDDVTDRILVHGSIEGWGNPPLSHGWVEAADGSMAWEPFSNKWYPMDAFNAYFSPVRYVSYTRAETMACMRLTEHYGPWEDGDWDDDGAWVWDDDEDEDAA